jgi:mRNA-degrading endonuclease HigB of HigAB toxin-antitoxin module
LLSLGGYEIAMRIAGISKLIRASSSCSAETAGAYRAFHAELEAASWRSPKDVLAAYPNAKFETQSLVVPFDGQHCVVVAIDYESEIALIKYAGHRTRRTGESSTRKYA